MVISLKLGTLLFSFGYVPYFKMKFMKAISIKQPWASLIAHGIKDIENRTWKCPQEVVIADCVQNHPSVWAEKGCWNWVLKDAILFEKPILNVKGKLSFWDFNL